MTQNRTHSKSSNNQSEQKKQLLSQWTAVHASIYVVFGLITLFMVNPSLDVLRYTISPFMVMLAVVHSYLYKTLSATEKDKSRFLFVTSSVVLCITTLIYLFFAREETSAGVILGIGWCISGAAQTIFSNKLKNNNALAKDWRFEGIMMLATGLSFWAVSGIGDRAMLGVFSCGAIITGVFLSTGVITWYRLGKPLEI
ncbi:hypothetical protein ACN08X_04800 [Rothia sp. P6271]|uniref:hypothetical protein n=1 Tax=Rothia sp. P6271 TaxID=3402659 RepID=UPI003AC19E0D